MINSCTFPVKLDLPAGNTMRPGQFVRIAVPVREYEALVIPAAAFVQRGQLQMVFVNENNIAKLRLTPAQVGNAAKASKFSPDSMAANRSSSKAQPSCWTANLSP